MFTNVTNQVTLIGRLGKDPEPLGDEQGARFDLAVNTSFMKDGERRERVDWLTIVCWNGLAKSCREHLAKGDRVAIAGALRVRTFSSEDATTRKVTKVVEVHATSVEFLDVKAHREGGSK